MCDESKNTQYETWCYFYNTRNELKDIINFLFELKDKDTRVRPFITRVSRPYTDKTKGGANVQGNWVVVAEIELDDNASNSVKWSTRGIVLTQGISRRLPTKSKWIEISNDHMLEFLETEIALGLCDVDYPKSAMYGNVNSFEAMVSSLVANLANSENKDTKVLIGTWFMVACEEVFNTNVKLVCGCGELIATNAFVECVSAQTNCLNK